LPLIADIWKKEWSATVRAQKSDRLYGERHAKVGRICHVSARIALVRACADCFLK
jgi:hypothetical protein